MCSFLGKIKTLFWCLTVQNRKLALFSLSIIVILGLTLSVTAFYFDFQYFETDKLVYEVGESVDMVAKLIADFSPEGWCYVSFAAVTDLGPVYADEYFISASPSPRLLNSSYTIMPSDTEPGVNGTTAHIIFNVEIFDTVSQGAGDNIEITITRGHLTVVPVTPLIVQSDNNATLTSQVVSIHNNSITYDNEPINIQIINPSSETILDTNTTTNVDGSFDFNWTSSMGLPGTYDLIVSGNGNDDFLSFSKTLPLSIVPNASNLTLISAPSSIQCQSPDGSTFETVNITVRHEAADYSGITDSTVLWNIGFDSGVMQNTGDGFYECLIPFQAPPGSYTINITTINPRYQTNIQLFSIDAEANILHFFAVQTNVSAIHGNDTFIEFIIQEDFDWGQEIPFIFLDSLGEFSISQDLLPNISESITLSSWYNLSIGSHIITAEPLSTYYNLSGVTEFKFNVIGNLFVDTLTESAYYGDYLQLNISLSNFNNNTINQISIAAFYTNESIPFWEIEQINTSQTILFPLPLSIQPGEHEFRFEINVPYYLTLTLNTNVTVWMNTTIIVIVESSSINLISSTIYHPTDFLGHYDWVIAERISSGSIIRPPPILFNEMTSTEFCTTRLTSLDNCPRFNSGTNILSTDSPNS